MVAWNDKQPGERLGAMQGLAGLTAWCMACGRFSDIPKARALELWGARTRIRDIARDLRCKVCGKRRAEIKIQALTWADYQASRKQASEQETIDREKDES